MIPSVEFCSDGTPRLNAVGEPAALQAALDGVPATVRIDVQRVGTYNAPLAPSAAPAAGLTDRQREVIEAAVDCDYYYVPNTGSSAEMENQLDCSTDPAAEHRRKGERTVMKSVVK